LTGDTDPSLSLVWNAEAGILVVAANALPPAAPGRTYQLWGIRGADAPVSLGTFETSAAGAALVALNPGVAPDFDVSALTDEPTGGSAQPTTQPFLVGAWGANRE
jgi:anti-sigma-K factor RskA